MREKLKLNPYSDYSMRESSSPWQRALIHYRVTYDPVHLHLNAPNRMCPISIIFKGDRTNVFILENRIRLN